jgi:hypothetical protein
MGGLGAGMAGHPNIPSVPPFPCNRPRDRLPNQREKTRMRRRDFIEGLGGAAAMKRREFIAGIGAMAWPMVALAQRSDRIRRIAS